MKSHRMSFERQLQVPLRRALTRSRQNDGGERMRCRHFGYEGSSCFCTSLRAFFQKSSMGRWPEHANSSYTGPPVHQNSHSRSGLLFAGATATEYGEV
jgi:hypothetical protein